jgi:tetratricopeptide (TPR) repeat protein
MRRAAIMFLAVILGGAARPEKVCPEAPPKSARARRELAGSWFERGRALFKEQRSAEAIKAYQCSMRIVPHAFTAYNLAKAAESAGDRVLAVKSYRDYLDLADRAVDRAEVEGRIAALEAELAAIAAASASASASVAREPPPPPPAVRREEPAPALEASAVEAPPALEVGAPRIEVVPPPVGEEEGAAPSIVPWIAGGGGVVLSGAGVAFNVLARGRADESRSAYLAEELERSDSAHRDATAFAYASYGLIAAGVAGLVTAAVLFVVE